jgi:hypothetical protein
MSIAAPEIGDALRYLKAAWPRNGSRLDEYRALQQFIGKLGDPAATFRKADGVVTAFVVGALLGDPRFSSVILALEPLGFMDTVPDDEGLKDAVFAVKGAFDAMTTTGGPFVPQSDDAQTASDQRTARIQELRELTEARVEYERLVGHLSERLSHYAQAIWSQWTDVQIAAALGARGIPQWAVESRFAAFIGGRAALRVTDLDWLREIAGVDWHDAFAKVQRKQTEPELITLPTPGMVVEPARGECNACDAFVNKHRDLDLEARTAEVDLAKARASQAQREADRFARRLDMGELGDPTPLEGADVGVRVTPP